MVYNRYIRNDRGVYTRIPEQESPSQQSSTAHGKPPVFPDMPQHEQERQNAPHRDPSPSPPPPPPPQQFSNSLDDSFSRTLRRLLDRFHLENVDTGDLLLLLLLFLLFKEDADEELLFALGLLLIL